MTENSQKELSLQIAREAARLRILQSATNDSDPEQKGTVGAGFGAQGHGARADGNWNSGQRGPTLKSGQSSSKLICTHCGMRKHTKETCFQLVGYPDWWSEGHRTVGKKKNVMGVTNDNSVRTGGGGGTVAARSKKQGAESGYQDGGDYWAWH